MQLSDYKITTHKTITVKGNDYTIEYETETDDVYVFDETNHILFSASRSEIEKILDILKIFTLNVEEGNHV